MLWRLGADAVMVLHLAFVAFAVVGGFLAWRWRRLVWLHLPVALYGVAIEVIGFTCPLTPFEKALRRRAGSDGYDGGFVEHYVVPVLYPGEFTAGLKLGLAVALSALTVFAYAVLWARTRLPQRRTPVSSLS
ncbi:MAG: DUF2784 domain-containing protein [Ilumatobacteraceae bacterium]